MEVAGAEDRFGDLSTRVGDAVRGLLSRPQRPTAIFAFCDAVARAAYRTLSELGMRIPDDVSIIGFDDDPMAEWLNPGLTTVRQPFAEMGRVAMEMLCRLMDNSHLPVEHQVLPVELIMRGSTAAV